MFHLRANYYELSFWEFIRYKKTLNEENKTWLISKENAGIIREQ
jgi:hypothetical protein